ncbi:MAG: Ala-tRNA(Pro) deacylase [Planctomycetota bacterium]
MTARIRDCLGQAGATWREIEHEETPTSADSARARGESMSIGGKALVIKVGKTLGLFVLPADRRLSARALRQHLGERRSRFATQEELLERTGLVPGSVPPFGRPVLDLPLYVDQHTWDSERIAFNAGSLTLSFILPSADWRAAVKVEDVFEFSLQ